MRFPAIGVVSTMWLVMGACGLDVPPPPPFYSLEIFCDSCRTIGLDTISIHDASGVRTIVLDRDGKATTSSTGESVYDGQTWFSSSMGPMVVESVDDWDTTVEIGLIPVDWGEKSFEDTVLTKVVQDPEPDSLVWRAQTRVDGRPSASGGFSFDYSWSQDLRIRPDEKGLYMLRVPKWLVRPGPPRTSRFTIGYRGMEFSFSSLLDSFPSLIWPPRLDSSTRYSIWSEAWDERLEGGGVRSTNLHRDASGAWVFHRVLVNGKDRIWEDSGSWDSARGFVRILKRGPGLAPSNDSFAFRPLKVLGATYRVWWWEVPADRDRPLEMALPSALGSPSWKYFARP